MIFNNEMEFFIENINEKIIENSLKLVDLNMIDLTTNHKFSQINLDLKAGDILFVTGLDDHLRTTFLMTILMDNKPISGELYIFGKKIDFSNKQEIYNIRKEIGYVNSKGGLIKSLTVKENIILPLLLKNKPYDEIEKIYDSVKKTLMISIDDNSEAWGIDKLEEKKILIARATIHNPKILLIDDPTSYVEKSDKDMVKFIIENLVFNYIIDIKNTIVIITTEDNDWANNYKNIFKLK